MVASGVNGFDDGAWILETLVKYMAKWGSNMSRRARIYLRGLPTGAFKIKHPVPSYLYNSYFLYSGRR